MPKPRATRQAKLDREQIASLENELRSSQRAGKELQAASTQLSSQLESERAQNEEQVRNIEQQKNVAESELEETRRALLKSRDETARFSSQLETERAQNEEQVRNIEQQKNVAESELEETRRALLKSRDETARFSGVLEIRNSNSAGLALYNARLRSRPEVSSGLLAVGVASKHGDPEMSAIADSILEDIERIRHPSFLWRMAKAFGVLRFAEPGVPRTAADRRAIARELKAAVREICKTLSSATTGPNEAAIKVTRLLELRRKTSEIVHSVNLSTLQRLKSPIWKIVHSERRAPGSFSEVTPASALFDAAWYLGQYPEVAALECDPLTHYLRRGAHEGRDPNPVFNTAWYLANNPNVAAADLNPLEHYLEFGARAGRDPSPLFDSSWYLEQNPDLGSDVNPLRHYLECGALEGRDPHPLFSTSWYLAQNPEVAGLNPLAHYVRWGCHLGAVRIRFSIAHGISNNTRMSQAPAWIRFKIIWNLGRAQAVIRVHCLIHPGIWSRTPILAPTSIRYGTTWNVERWRDAIRIPSSTPPGICDRIRRLRPGRLTRSSTTFFRALTKADRRIRFSIAHGISNNTRMSQDLTRLHIT